MELTPRLQTVAELVPQGSRFADIGTDHAYLPTWLILNDVIDWAIAADLRQGPLERAKDTAEKYAVSDKMDFRLCDGLTGILPGEVDTIVIAGMGGETIAHILACAPWTKEPGTSLILQPMSSQKDLRQWLGSNGYVIEQERISREDKTLYNIMLVKPGVMPDMTAAELIAGRQSNDPLRGEYLNFLITKTSRALDGQRAAVQKNIYSIQQFELILEGLLAMKKEWDAWQR